MWPRFTTSSSYKGKVKMKQPCKSINLNDEYLCAVRTKSFADFFVKVQVNLANHPSLPSPSPLSSSSKDSHLLEPGQETITSLLHDSPSNHGLKSLLSNYFHISAEASDYCSNLLKTLIHLQSDHTDLRRRYAGLNRHDFACIHEKHSSVLHQLRSSRKRVARKMKTIRAVNITSMVFVTAACGVAAAAAMVVAAHTLTAILVGPMMVALKPLKKKLKGLGLVMKYRVLRRVAEQLDVAAKGAYILNRDFDTMGRLVGRLEDEIEHKKAMMEMCVERRKERSFCQQVMKELEKYELGFIKQVEELEEHVYLCLATINRARALVAKEISSGNKS